MSAPTSAAPISERSIIVIAGLIHFINMTDFMMVMPLGPDFAVALGIPTSDIGLIAGSYTLAAGVMGLLSALLLDRFSRKKALLFFLVGLSCATLTGALVWDKSSMVGARLLAGLFGGPLTALATALVADWIPAERRGQAMGKVMGGFAAATVLGVPFGLELSSRISWNAPFIATGLLGLLAAVIVWMKLPHYKPAPHDNPLEQKPGHLLRMLRSPLALSSYAFMVISLLSAFMVIPNISAHIQNNLGFPRSQVGLLFLAGGILSFFGMRAAGYLIDKFSATLTVSMFTLSMIVTLAAGFVFFPNFIPVSVIFAMFMVSATGRTVCIQTLASKIPSPGERGAYMSVQSACTHFASALGAYFSSLILVEEGGKLLYMPMVGMIAIALSILVPLLVWNVERQIKKLTV